MATHYDIVSAGTVSSTQDVASARHAATGRPTLVVASHQTRGRGRQGRTWEEPTRAMFSSYSFETVAPPERRPVITLTVAVALSEAIEAVTGVRTDIKWPNDLLVDGSKVAGILVESTGDVVTVGCGANLWWPDPPPHAAGVLTHDPGGTMATELARGWVDRLVRYLERGPGDWPRAIYLERSCTLGHEVVWQTGSGVAVDIADDGGLIVETGDGTETITAGEVHLRRER